VFNKGFGPSFLIRLVRALYREIFMFPSKDSVFFDSPINHEGAEQAKKLLAFLEQKETSQRKQEVQQLVEILKGNQGSSVIASSNLRRCIETTTIALWGRLHRRQEEKVKILSCLQEISRNIDTIALAERGEVPVLSEIEAEMKSPFKNYDTTENFGNKLIRSCGSDRIAAFADWIFGRKEDHIIVGCHSLYARDFFRQYLPYTKDHIAKNAKIRNCGVIYFQICRGIAGQRVHYRIDPTSIKQIYLDFENPSKKVWKPPRHS